MSDYMKALEILIGEESITVIPFPSDPPPACSKPGIGKRRLLKVIGDEVAKAGDELVLTLQQRRVFHEHRKSCEYCEVAYPNARNLVSALRRIGTKAKRRKPV